MFKLKNEGIRVNRKVSTKTVLHIKLFNTVRVRVGVCVCVCVCVCVHARAH